MGGATKVLDEAFHPGHVLEIVEYEFLGFRSQIDMKLTRENTLDDLASFRHECFVIVDLWPLCPCIFVRESLEHEKPEL